MLLTSLLLLILLLQSGLLAVLLLGMFGRCLLLFLILPLLLCLKLGVTCPCCSYSSCCGCCWRRSVIVVTVTEVDRLHILLQLLLLCCGCIYGLPTGPLVSAL
jgi:hypothetical protein